MKQTNACPKCGGTELLQVPDGVDSTGISLHLGLFHRVPVSRWVCTRCGYAESWVDKPYLPELREQYEKEQRKK